MVFRIVNASQVGPKPETPFASTIPPGPTLTGSVSRFAIAASELRKKTRPFDTASGCPLTLGAASTARSGESGVSTGVSTAPNRKMRTIASAKSSSPFVDAAVVPQLGLEEGEHVVVWTPQPGRRPQPGS